MSTNRGRDSEILTCYVAATNEQRQLLLRVEKPSPYVVLSPVRFAGQPVILLSESDARRFREVKSRLFQYVSFSKYRYIVYSAIAARPILVPPDNKIGLRYSEMPIKRYSPFLTAMERQTLTHLYSTESVAIPTTNVGLLFMDFWNRYTCRLKADHENLALTLVASRHFSKHIHHV